MEKRSFHLRQLPSILAASQLFSPGSTGYGEDKSILSLAAEHLDREDRAVQNILP